MLHDRSGGRNGSSPNGSPHKANGAVAAQQGLVHEGYHAAAKPGVVGRDRLEIRVGSRIYDMERSLIEATLDHFQGNKRRAADALGCSLKTLYNKLNGYSQNQHCATNSL
jgi:DNA-binding NtrC family response regulator